MPPAFVFPPGEVDPPELWSPLQLDPAKPGGRGSHYLSILARLRTGVTMAQAQGEMTRYVVQRGTDRQPNTHPSTPNSTPSCWPIFRTKWSQACGAAMLVLLGAVAFVLLIACVNVANLLLARAEARRREIAVRAAVGAGFGQLLRQFVIEGILLSRGRRRLRHAAGVRRAAPAGGDQRGQHPARGRDEHRLAGAGVHPGGLSFATGMVFGLAPISMHKVAACAAARHHEVGGGAGRPGAAANRFRAVLVTTELALALVLLIGAGLMVKAFWKLQQVDAGVNPEHVLTMRLALPIAGVFRSGEDQELLRALLLARDRRIARA